MDRKIAASIQAEMIAASQAIAKKYSVTIRGGGGTIGMNDAVIKFKIEDDSAEAKDSKEFMLKRLMKALGVAKKAHGNRKLVAIMPNRPKNPVVFEQNGKRYKCSVEYWNSLS